MDVGYGGVVVLLVPIAAGLGTQYMGEICAARALLLSVSIRCNVL